MLAEDDEIVAIGNLGIALGTDGSTGLVGAQMVSPGRRNVPRLGLFGFLDIFKIFGGIGFDADFRLHF